MTANDSNDDSKNFRAVIHNYLVSRWNDSMTAMTANPLTILLVEKRDHNRRKNREESMSKKAKSLMPKHQGFTNSELIPRGEREIVTRKTKS